MSRNNQIIKPHEKITCGEIVRDSNVIILFFQFVIIILVGATVTSCSVIKRNHQNTPDDFNFLARYGYSYGYKVDTYQNTFTKCFGWNSDTVIKFSISDKQKSLVYNEIKRCKISDYTTDFKPYSRIKSIPTPMYYLRFTIDGVEKEIIWETNTESNKCKAVHLRKVFDLIDSYTNQDSTILNLPEDTRVLF
jgi:hypothetical protein